MNIFRNRKNCCVPRNCCHNCGHHRNDPMASNNIFAFNEVNEVNAVIEPCQVNDLANHLLEEYYGKVGNTGWNAVQHIYVPDAVITCNTNVYSGGHQFLNALSTDYIRRANYGYMNATWSQIDESKMMITVFGEIQLVNFTGECSGVGHFSESFIIKVFPGQTYAVTHHHLYFH